MWAARIHQYGGRETLRYEEAPDPTLRDDDVRVRVHAAAVNPVDWKIREGRLAGVLGHTLPLVLGWDLSGVVEAVGPAVTDVAVGDEVYARPDIGRDGAYAELIAVRASEVAPKPRSLSHVEAAAVPLTALTAWQSLFEAASLKAGQRVLVHGGAGGVGGFAVQLAKRAGAEVIATASAPNAGYVRELGADRVIDYQREAFEEVSGEVDVVLDTIGGEVQARSYPVLRKGGTLVSIIATPDVAVAEAHGVRGAFVFVQPSRAGLVAIAEHIDAGAVRVFVRERFALKDVAEAHRLIETGHGRGKLVLTIPGAG
ncbi:MAG: NADP-dependent oxidoreductase [Myxococcales bacterium]|nr:NADP-dependent oxidoreductase [Myxococcales bacterium]